LEIGDWRLSDNTQSLITHEDYRMAKNHRGRMAVVWMSILLGLCMTLTACAAQPVPASPNALQAELLAAWRQPQHGQWSLVWAQSPLPGPLVFEAWLTESAEAARFEILEADAPGWVGLAYTSDGHRAAYVNRLEDTPPVHGSAAELAFAPVSHAWARVDALLAQPPQSAQASRFRGDPVQKIALRYPTGQAVTAWFNTQTGFVVRAEVTGPDINLTLAARSIEPLEKPSPALFQIRAAP